MPLHGSLADLRPAMRQHLAQARHYPRHGYEREYHLRCAWAMRRQLRRMEWQ